MNTAANRRNPLGRAQVCRGTALALLAIVAGPWAQAGATGLVEPGGGELRPAEIERKLINGAARIQVAWPQQGGRLIAPGQLDEDELEALVRRYLAELEPAAIRSLWIGAEAPRSWPANDIARGQLVGLNALLPAAAPVPRRPWEPTGDLPPAAPAWGRHGWTGDAKGGGLAGRAVYVSGGHGWYWSTNLGRWATQRGNTHNIVEDFVNSEAVNHYLVPLLRNAGAQVITVREHDMQPAMVVVDDGDPVGKDGAGYSEQGSFQPGTAEGFANGKAPYSGDTNPFALGGYRAVAVVKGAPTATASFVPALPEAGMYSVQVGYTAGANRSQDAHFEIRHSGGISHRRVNMQRHGQTWVWLGTFHFAAGVDPAHGAVLLHNDTQAPETGTYVIADVVRFGGGEGLIVRGNGAPPTKGPTSGRPRWEECARYHAQYSGAPPTVWDPSTADNKDDVTTRSRFSAWHHEQGEDAVFVSWHSNAPDPGRGTSTYVYGPNPPDGSYQFSGTKGSDVLGKLLQESLVADIRAVFDAKWKDRGIRSAWFGEINPNNNGEMPAALVEVAFHSTAADADYLREPRFRHLLARAFYKAIVRYFAGRDGIPVKLLPEPPAALRLQVLGPAAGRLSWQAGQSGGVFGDPAAWYLVQRSKDGRGFDDGQLVKGTTLDLVLPETGLPLFVRVLAANDGGISLPSAVLGASSGCTAQAQAVVVQGFSRLSAGQMPVDDLSAWSLASVQRLRQWRMNRFDYAIEHVLGLAAAGVSVDGMEREAVTASTLVGYGLIDWAAGEQSTADGVWTEAERALLTTWLQGGAGRALLASGAEIAWAVGHKGTPASADWLATWFGAQYADDDAGTYGFSGVAGAKFPVAASTFDDGSQHAYDVDFPDVLEAVGGKALLEYSDGKGVAAVAHGVGGAHTALLGFPIEAVGPQAARHGLFAALLDELAVPAEQWPCPVAVADEPAVAEGRAPDAGGTDGGGLDVQPPPSGRPAGADDGCGCRVSAQPGPTAGAGLLLLGLGALLLRLRRRDREWRP